MNIYAKVSIAVVSILLLLAISTGLLIYLSTRGPRTEVPVVNSSAQTLGSGQPLTFVVLGDSTSAGQGGNYTTGIAQSSAEYLAKSNTVTFYNFSVSGARINDVLNKQWPKAESLKPNVVLVSAGANDVTGRTSLKKVSIDFDKLINKIIEANCDSKIVLTGSPDMGSIPRLVQPLRALAGTRSESLNKVVDKLVKKYEIIRAPIAEKTGPAFRKDRFLFAIDKFHPNDAGYQVWIPVLTAALDAAKSMQKSRCS
ncbi:SGNH/GDSL hydrolase family protein [Candidatus Saccharibacteria bacterium]|nr:SGNH/GDSL hydrolase family protein [Candidatus Saccharibacteria bacterium]